MKNGFIYLLVISLLLSGKTLQKYENHSEIKAVESLLNQRIDIMNDFLYGEKNLYGLRNSLMKIETDPILESDMDVLKAVMDNPTDFEEALSVSVGSIENLIDDDEAFHMTAELKWIMRGYDNKYALTRNYEIKCKKVNGSIYLSALKITDK